MTQTTTQPTAPTTALPPANEMPGAPGGRPMPGGAPGEGVVADRAARAPRGTAPGTGPRPTPLVVPGVPAAVSAAELAAIAGSTAAYAGGVPGLLAAGAIAGTTAAVATVRRARARRTARRNGVVGTRVSGGSRRAGGTGRRGGLMSRARAAMAARRQRSAPGAASASGTRRTPPGARAAAAHAQRAGRGNKPVTRTVPPGGRATTGTGRGTTRRGPLGRLLGQSRSAGDRRAAGRGSRGLFGRKPASGAAGNRTAGGRGRGRASGATGSRSATGGNGVGGHGARRTSNPIRQAWREAASQRKALRDNARQAYRDAERARGRHRMVRQIIADAPTPRHARSATYRIVYAPARRAGERPVPLAPLRAVSAAGWATGAWVAASGYAAWSRHWQTQQQLALGVATGNRGYVVAERVRPAPEPKPDSGSVIAPPAARPVIVRLPKWRFGTGRAVFGTSGSTTPTQVGSPIPTSGGNSVSRFNISDLAMEQAARAARYTPDTMAFFGADLAQWPEAIGHLALALSTFVKRGTAEFPVHPQVMEKLAEVYKALGTAAAAANEAPALFSRAHSIDLSRHQAPRPGEHLWNVNR